jgi:hypothetical protein
MMLEKLTWIRYGMVLFAGLLFACTQEPREPVEVGAAQVELRSDLDLSEAPRSSSALSPEENPDHLGPPASPMPTIQRIPLTGSMSDSQDHAYEAVSRYEFPLRNPKALKVSTQESNTHTNSWPLASKHWVRTGKGFGVAAEGTAPPGIVHINDAEYYFPTVALKPYSEATEHLEPVADPFKSSKPLVFHSGATGFAHEPPTEATPSRHSSSFETRLELSPIPETQVYFSSQPKTKVTLAPAKNRLDLMNGNENLNRDRFGKLP